MWILPAIFLAVHPLVQALNMKTIKILTTFLITLLVAFLFISFAHATTYYVCASGSTCNSVTGSDSNNGTTTSTPWLTYSKVNANAQAAGDVYNFAGTFTGVRLAVDASGTIGSHITFQQWSGQPSWVTNANLAVSNCFLNDSFNYIDISGMSSCINTTGDGIKYFANTATITGGTISNITTSNTGVTGYFDGIHLLGIFTLATVTVSNTITHDASGAGLEVEGVVNGVTLNNNTQYHNGIGVAQENLELFSDFTTVNSGWTNTSGNIYDQAVSLSGNQAIYRVLDLTDGNELTLSAGNFASLTNGQYDFHAGALYINIGKSPSGVNISFAYSHVQHVVITNDISYNAVAFGGQEGEGINFDNFTSDSSISNSFIFNNAGCGVGDNQGLNDSLNYSVLYGNLNDGVNINNYSTMNVYNNTIDSSVGIGLNVFNPSNISAVFNFKNNIITNSTTYGIQGYFTQIGIVSDYNDVFNSTTSNYNGAVSKGTHDINSDPLFVNRPGNNYQLTINSPALNAGTNVGLNSDILGNSIPQGIGFSMGAYENTFASISNGQISNGVAN